MDARIIRNAMRHLPMKTVSDSTDMTRLECMDCSYKENRTVDECWRISESPRCKECGGAMFPHGLFSPPEND